MYERVKHRLQIESRAADDLEDVGGGGLLLQRFPQLVEQPGILDGNDGLVGETLDQLDLLVGERSNLLPKNVDNTNQLALFEHRDREHCSKAAQFNGFDDRSKPFSVGLRCPDVRDLDDLLRAGDLPERRAWMWSERFAPARARLAVARRRIMRGNHAEGVRFAEIQRAELGVTGAHGIFQHGLEHWVQLAGRTGNYT